ncbi:hypothetical protein [Streptomyces sp. YIM 98790]|uniref:hypothetical protein n=1 Tax=Streptomyces sp. YIM 98790 TaxID=2689077 RepID=UPI00140A499F|nr:hypothetical protein [Streptomyces sp. YIM 98790]
MRPLVPRVPQVSLAVPAMVLLGGVPATAAVLRRRRSARTRRTATPGTGSSDGPRM